MEDIKTSPQESTEASCRPESFSWSRDEERYHGEFATREAALEEAAAEYPEQEAFWTGLIVRPNVKAWLPDVDHQIEAMQERAWEEAGEISETFMEDVTKDQRKELQAEMDAVMLAWMARHNLEPRFWLVEQVEEHEMPQVGTIASGVTTDEA